MKKGEMKKVGMQEMGTTTTRLKGGGGAQGEEQEGLLSIRSEFRSSHWQTRALIIIRARVYGRDRGFREVVVGTKIMLIVSRFW
jgi:hypothetical protein